MSDHAPDDPTDPRTAAEPVRPAGPPGPTAPASLPGPADETDPWETVDRLHGWLDANPAHGGTDGLLLRVLKLSEEVGEVAEAVIGATGQNPRKGVSHSWDDVRSELCDVVVTAMVALRGLTPDAREVFAAHLAAVRDRSLSTAPRPSSAPPPGRTGQQT
ncbi:MazG-like family protein [Streptomyces sp. NPDC048566]|uniref:MazG-like family protein n=1 Tax=Streptomyces sp. NPDC048566 TaxID=3365569 RepID=UPI0037136205